MSCRSLSCDGDQPPDRPDRAVHFISDVERKSMDFDFNPENVSDAGASRNSARSSAMSRSAPASVPAVIGARSPADADSSPSVRFPRLEECAHFHYGRVKLGGLRVHIVENDPHSAREREGDEAGWVSIIVRPHGDLDDPANVSDENRDPFARNELDDNCTEWTVTRSADNFKMLDTMLHRCIYDRKVSGLPDLTEGIEALRSDDGSSYYSLIADYLHHFSIIADDTINCGPILNWFQMDNKGHKLLVASEDCNSINTPAVAAAYSVRRYVSQARDEISFEVGDMISVIDMPGPSESTWWRGKRGFRVGFFPQECVAVIGDKVPRNMKQPPPIVGSVTVASIKPVLRKHGKLISLFRSFILSRPSRRSLRQQGILRERVFGCDLGEHLLNSGNDVPQVLTWCASIIEEHGCVDGIYRLSGAASATQRLRLAFDEERPPPNPPSPLDVHSVASLLKMYFRELPNPLCTYQLYSCFVSAVKSRDLGDGTEVRRLDDSEKLIRMRETVVKLPPPHYRTLHYLMRHLHKMSLLSDNTGMTARNMGIVWAPNLLRSPLQEFSLSGVAIQVVVTEFLICYADLIFSNDQQPLESSSTLYNTNDLQDSHESHVSTLVKRPKSLPIATPTKLLSLEEARNKQQLRPSVPKEPHYIEVGEGPNSLPRYHTVIQLPPGAAKRGLKRSPSGWRGLFFRANKHRLMPASSHGHPTISEPTQIQAVKSVDDNLQIMKKDENVSRTTEKMTIDTEDTRSTRSCESLGSEGDSLPPLLIPSEPKAVGSHNRSASCDSYFEASLAELAGMRLRLTSQEREMDIFSEDDTARQGWNKNESSSNDTTAEPSPVKNSQTVDEKYSPNKNYNGKHIEDDLLFIDCSTPEHSANIRNKNTVEISTSSSMLNNSSISQKESYSMDTLHVSNDASSTAFKVKMRERNSPRRNDKTQLSRHSHCGLLPSSKVNTNPQRHSTLIRVDWLDTVANEQVTNPNLCGYTQLQSDSDTSLQTRESKDSLLKHLLESKESLMSRTLEDNYSKMNKSGCTLTWDSNEQLQSNVETYKPSLSDSLQNEPKFKKGEVLLNINERDKSSNSDLVLKLTKVLNPNKTSSSHTEEKKMQELSCRKLPKSNSPLAEELHINKDYDDVQTPLLAVCSRNKMTTSSDSEICQSEDNLIIKSKVTITPSDENFSSNMVDSLDGSLSPSNISYQNLNRLSMLSGESGKISVSKESTPTFSPHEQEKTEEIYECFSFSKPSYINLGSSSGGSTPASPKNKSPLKSTISITYRSPSKDNASFDLDATMPSSYNDASIDFNENLGEIRIYENVEDKVVIPSSSEASLPTQVANDQCLEKEISTCDKSIDQTNINSDIDIYNQVKFFRQSIHEVNSLIMESDEDFKQNSMCNEDVNQTCPPKTNKEPSVLYENVEYVENQHKPQHSYENVNMRKKADKNETKNITTSPLADFCFDMNSKTSYENITFRKHEDVLQRSHKKELFDSLPIVSLCESDKENSDENKNVASLTGDTFMGKRSSVKQLAHKFESPVENKGPFNFDRLSKLNFSEKSCYDRCKASSMYEGRSKMNTLGKTIPSVRTRSHKLTRNSNNTRSLDENAFIKEFVNYPIHKDHISDVEITDCNLISSRRKSLEALKYLNQPKHLPDLNLNVECGKSCIAKSDLTLNLNTFKDDIKESNSSSYSNNFINITPTTENKICLVQARLSPKKSVKSKQKWECREDARDFSDDLGRETIDDLQDNTLDQGKKEQLSRERIEKYKEERRLFLREKYSSQSFRGSSDIQGANKGKSDDISQEDAKLRNYGMLERRNTADCVQRNRFTAGKPTLQNEFKTPECGSISNQTQSVDTATANEAESKNKSLQDISTLSPCLGRDELGSQFPKNIYKDKNQPQSDVSSASVNRKEKRSPSFNIRDMAAIFEQKSAGNMLPGQNQKDVT